MKTTIKKILNAKDTLLRISNEQLPIKQSYGIAKIIRAVDPELEFYQKENEKLFKKYGNLTEDGTKYIIATENTETFQKAYDELLNQTVGLDITPVPLTDVTLSAQEVLHLEGFIEVSDFE